MATIGQKEERIKKGMMGEKELDGIIPMNYKRGEGKRHNNQKQPGEATMHYLGFFAVQLAIVVIGYYY